MGTGRIRRNPSISTRAMIVIAVVGLILLATAAYFAPTAARPDDRPGMFPIRWSGDLAV